MRQLLEFVQLRLLPGAGAIDWSARLVDLDRIGLGEAVRAYLLAGERLFAQPLPPGVTPGLAARWSERRCWFLVDHPRLSSPYQLARRLGRLPKRLITPGWLLAKVRHLRQLWSQRL